MVIVYQRQQAASLAMRLDSASAKTIMKRIALLQNNYLYWIINLPSSVKQWLLLLNYSGALLDGSPFPSIHVQSVL
jgi:hypothetical protein